MPLWRSVAVFVLAALVACERQAHIEPADVAPDLARELRGTTAPRAPPPAPAHELREADDAVRGGDAMRGAALAVRFECVRCHAHAGLSPATRDDDCAGCHAQVARGVLDVGADTATLAEWRRRVHSYLNVPSLTHVGARLRRSAIAQVLREPHDVRPHLAETMPRLPISAADGADLATWLAPESEARMPAPPRDEITLARGRQLFEELGCGLCHTRAGERLGARALRVAMHADALARAYALAPDLAEVGTRVRRDRLVQWILDPRSIDPDATMPALPRSREEAEAIAAWLLSAPIVARAPDAIPARLPLLARRVTFAEVQERVFRRSCWHCHSEPDFNEGDGGPGNTGGFGFAGRGLSLASASAVRSGARDDDGVRRSVLSSPSGGTPRLVEALLARQREEAGDVRALRGMPLGLPAVSAEDVQLVESWIAGGAGE